MVLKMKKTKYGKLTIINTKKEGRYLMAVCQCECGNRKTIRFTSLTKKKQPTQSCGCLQKEFAKEQGQESIAQNSKTVVDNNIKYNTNIALIYRDKPQSHNTSGQKGISWSKEKRKWHVYINIHNKRKHIGYYISFEEAVKYRKLAEELYHKPIKNKIMEDNTNE